jgi:hypothetical protein
LKIEFFEPWCPEKGNKKIQNLRQMRKKPQKMRKAAKDKEYYVEVVNKEEARVSLCS